jgi:hypothetical protein
VIHVRVFCRQAFEETPTRMSIKINRLEEGHNSYPWVCRRPAETFLDLYLEFDDSGQLSTKVYDKRDDFNFKIIVNVKNIFTSHIDKKILDILDFFIFIHFHYMKMHRLSVVD